MQNRFNVVVLLFVPILGLNSCSKKSDDWQMTEPVIESATAEPLKLESASSRTLAGDSALTFVGAPWQSLTVKSVCKANDQTFENAAHTTFASSILLRHLWPPQLWKSLSNNQLTASECSFSFEATNSLGSTQTFQLSKVRLTTFTSSFDQEKIKTMSAAAPDLDLQASTQFSEAVTTLSERMSDAAEISMVCADQMVSAPMASVLRSASFVQSMMNKLGLRGQRQCRFLAFDAKKDGIQVFELSEDLPIRFPKVAISVTTRSTGRLGAAGLGNANVLVVEMTNRSDASTVISVPLETLVNFKLLVNGTHSNQSKIYAGDVETMAAIVSVGAGSPVVADGTSQRFTLGPNETRAIEIAFIDDNAARLCFIGDTTGVNPGPPSIGFQFGFRDGFIIRQLDAEDSAGEVTLELPKPSSNRLVSSTVFELRRADLGVDISEAQIAHGEIPGGATPACFR